jgi:hypothetical protein
LLSGREIRFLLFVGKTQQLDGRRRVFCGKLQKNFRRRKTGQFSDVVTDLRGNAKGKLGSSLPFAN